MQFDYACACGGVLIGGGLMLWIGRALWVAEAWPDPAVGVAVAGIALKGDIDMQRDAHGETDLHKAHADG